MKRGQRGHAPHRAGFPHHPAPGRLGGVEASPRRTTAPDLERTSPGVAPLHNGGVMHPPPGSVIVGERGPEPFVLPRPAQVMKHRDLSRVGGFKMAEPVPYSERFVRPHSRWWALAHYWRRYVRPVLAGVAVAAAVFAVGVLIALVGG